MKPKTIELTIKCKINAWKKSIIKYAESDKALHKYKALADKIDENYIVTGGCIVSMLSKEVPNDYDIYFKDVNFAAELAQYYLDRFGKDANQAHIIRPDGKDGEPDRVRIFIKSSGVIKPSKKPEEKSYMPACITENAITLSDGIQLIMRFTGSPAEIHKNFDFVHVTSYMTEKDGLVLNQAALISILTKELKYIGSRYPLSSIIRTRKFIKRGWSCGADAYLKMGYDLSKLNLEDVSVLKDQLIGVDVLHFNDLISALKNSERPTDVEFRPYLFDLIDDIFKLSNHEHENFGDDE